MPAGVRLSRREREIVSGLLEGRTNRQIAERFQVSEQTIKNQLRTLFAKCRVKGRLQLALLAVNERLLENGD